MERVSNYKTASKAGNTLLDYINLENKKMNDIKYLHDLQTTLFGKIDKNDFRACYELRELFNGILNMIWDEMRAGTGFRLRIDKRFCVDRVYFTLLDKQFNSVMEICKRLTAIKYSL
jgi:hypothetical protein